ncbi:hypothetical protein FK178_09775 [Antarcticibacterium arcticum]|uniref:Lipocalin-like domain-containing protein n=1 Tax=Antarcticibacterium arcticum TaxID=2585771 RepID=A0A5B8YMF8_9FLAO|nr:hypothetical protein [Antarcticibacterium arcticum]QED37997.1 hypothetical protein FK178_09775 [Antarcticibacterium arcticum]
MIVIKKLKMKNKPLFTMIAGIMITLVSVTAPAQTTIEEMEEQEPYLSTDECSEIKSRILGSWVLENNTSNKMVFSSDNILKRYYNGVLKSMETFSISSFCGGESLSSKYFLVTTTSNGTTDCVYLENVNDDNSGFLTLITPGQGKIIVYKKI